MKKTILAAAAAATLFITTCHLFDAHEKDASANPLVGTWSFDSIRYGMDSTNLPMEYALLSLAFLDSNNIHFQITPDSIITLEEDNVDNRVAYRFDHTTQQVIIIDSPQTTFSFVPLNDSTVTLIKKDTLTMYLSKKHKL